MTRARGIAGSRLRARRDEATAGFTLVELLLSTTMAALVSGAFISILVAQIRVAAVSSSTTTRDETLRLPSVLFATEFSLLAPERDIRFVEQRVIGIRAFRGSGIVCGGSGGLIVRYAGIRQPDPTKDSVLVLGATETRAAALLDSNAASGSGCGASEEHTYLLWSLSEPATAGDVVLLFESGSYHLADGAVRYRRGAGGRQPITPELLDDAESWLRPYDESGGTTFDPARLFGIELRLVPAQPRDLRAAPEIPPLSRRIPLLNRHGDTGGG